MSTIEKRRTERTAHESTVFVQTITSSQVESLQLSESSEKGITQNISSHGLQVVVDLELLEGSEIAMWMLLANSEERLLLTGYVQWVTPHDDGARFRVGVALREESFDDMERYQQLISFT